MSTAVNLVNAGKKAKLDSLRQLFLHHDSDHSGQMDRKELSNALR